ncbi:hypothetical protein GCM10009544_01770 [Streptomyces stramineus]|uniref:Transposase n=1 Tax=Streptomyces stramineus TaxID=173861 RepID=A0ABN0ZBP0_9ACTN
MDGDRQGAAVRSTVPLGHDPVDALAYDGSGISTGLAGFRKLAG